MSRQVSPSTDKIYGLQRVTRLWGVSRATLYRHRRPARVAERKRPGPLGAMADEDLVVAIRQTAAASPHIFCLHRAAGHIHPSQWTPSSTSAFMIDVEARSA